VARSRDQSELPWPNAVPVSLETGGGIPCRTRRPNFLLKQNSDMSVTQLLAAAVANINFAVDSLIVYYGEHIVLQDQEDGAIVENARLPISVL